MVNVKLTRTQKQILNHMPTNVWLSAYDLKTSMATLNSLYKKGLVRRRGVGLLGSFYSPRTTVEYLKPAENP